MKWQKVKLIDLVEKPISGEWGTGEGSIKVLRTTNFTNDGTLNLTDIVQRDIPYNKVEKKKLLKGDIIIEKSGGSPSQPVGRVVHFLENNGIYLCNNFTAVLRPKENVNARYLFWNLFSGHINGSTLKYQNKTTGIINLQLERFTQEFEISLPPLPIQQQIADTLDIADALRRKDQELLDKYDELAQAVFYEMFGDPVLNEKGWNIFKIRDVCDFSQGIQIPIEEHYFECTSGMKRFLRISDYTQSVEPRYVVTEKNKAWVEKDDIVMVRYGASAGFIGFGLEGVLANNLFKFNIDKKNLLPYYLLYFLNTTYFQNFIKRVAFGAAMPALSFRSFDDVNIPVPDIKTQIAFSIRIKNIIDQKNLCISTLNESLSLFNSELNKHFI